MTVRQMSERMDGVELSYWKAYFQLENEKDKKGKKESPDEEDDD